MILLLDNYDSFTYNLFQLVEALGHHCVVKRNDEISVAGIEALAPKGIMLSPGPGRPEDAGVTLAVIRAFAGRIPILGVCLGHQAIGAAFGASVARARRPKHGKVSALRHEGRGLFAGVPSPFPAARYHSLVVERNGLPDCLEVTCQAADGTIMGLRHREHAIEGLQFHPESVATPEGPAMVRNFLAQIGQPS